MKKYTFVKIILICTLLFASFYPQKVFSSVDNSLEDKAANALVSLRIMRGYEDGTLKLENPIKRSEFITLIVNSLGYPLYSEDKNSSVFFSDISKNHWAYNHIQTAVKNELVLGYPDNTIMPDNTITYAEALAVLIRTLGYEETLTSSWPDNVIDKANELELNKNILLDSNKELTRGEMSLLIYNSLTIDLYN